MKQVLNGNSDRNCKSVSVGMPTAKSRTFTSCGYCHISFGSLQVCGPGGGLGAGPGPQENTAVPLAAPLPAVHPPWLINQLPIIYTLLQYQLPRTLPCEFPHTSPLAASHRKSSNNTEPLNLAPLCHGGVGDCLAPGCGQSCPTQPTYFYAPEYTSAAAR